ncbi:MAG: DNA-3-methyladenine glycosylase [Desulfobacterales bacterium]|nr:MAG: DNA-3-methyladenine glycosylase [Desulfobacterales bacterium]
MPGNAEINFVGVKTTGIYCRPDCPARTPLPQNRVYFKTARQAERAGYRACRRCFPDFPPGKWGDQGSSVFLRTPPVFDFTACLKYLARSPQEPCHRVAQETLYKLLRFGQEPVLLQIRPEDSNCLGIAFLTPRPKKSIRALAAKYVWDWFDLETDLQPFYRMARKDAVLKNLVDPYYGLRLVTIPDLFEATCWAIIGQQINLKFAYALKKRFVESFGEKFNFNARAFYLFPAPDVIARQSVATLRRLQFTAQKSEYIIELAQKIQSGTFDKKALLKNNNLKSAQRELMRLRGVGKWTAAYVGLRCFKDPAALPVDDIGLQNAIKQQLGMTTKPTGKEIEGLAAPWKNWKAYATFYLWNSLA